MASVRVTSEIGNLETVLVHTPGGELEAVTPGTREDYLYDDLIGLDVAAREHRRLVGVLKKVSRVHQVADLLAQTLAQAEARDFLISRTMDVVSSAPLAQQLADLAPRALVKLLIEGSQEPGGPISRTVNQVEFALPPLPNLFFPRDIGLVLGDHAVVGSMRYGIRWTEELLIKTLFRFHPDLSNAGLLYDGSEERRSNYTLEGGDIHIIRPDLIVAGFSERTSPAALDQLCDEAFARTGLTDVIVVVMPREPTAIHLDMLFTQLDRELCAVYPPAFIGPERLTVLHRKKGRKTVKERDNIFVALSQVGLKLVPVLTGGKRRLSQEREQWSSGCNFLAVRPGVVLSYQRNDETLRELEAAGFTIVPNQDFLAFDDWDESRGRVAITIPGGELVRGGGGPRCMTLPLRRADVW
ncbi:MAG: arginine deiminase family protein [Gemmatimonadales bacterium]